MASIPDSVNYELCKLPLQCRQWNRTVMAARRQVTLTKNKQTKVVIKRRRDEEEIKTANVDNIKRVRTEQLSTNLDMFTNLPECLKLHILSFLDAKSVVRTSMLLRTWKPLWTSIPTLNFSSFEGFKYLKNFDKFVNMNLSFRDPVKLDRLTFYRGKVSSAKILDTVFSYALAHNVKELDSWIHVSRKKSWPNCLENSSNSLTSLKLRSDEDTICPFLRPQSGPFKNLAILYLRKAIISDLQPFSGFMVLEKLTLIDCRIDTEGKTLNIHALKLLELEISCYERIDRLELVTPNLKFFEFRALNFPLLKTPQGLPVLETVVIDYHKVRFHMNEKQTFEDLLSLFLGVYTTKSLKIFSHVVDVLSLFEDELMKRSSPFWNLKFVKVDYSRRWSSEPRETPSVVITNYLLKNCSDAKFSLMYRKRDCAKCKALCTCVEVVVVC